MSTISTVAILGAGQMGAGIAQAVALGGYSVRLYDVVADRLPMAQGEIAASLARQRRPSQVTGWAVIGGTGSGDGRTARVVLRGTVRPPLSGGLLSLIGKDVTITVQSDARSETDGPG